MTSDNEETQPFPASKWRGFQLRMTKSVREFTKRWKKDRSGFRVDGGATCMLQVTLYMRGDGELIGWSSPDVTGLEPRSHDWVNELNLDSASVGSG